MFNTVHCVMLFAHYIEVSPTYSVSEVWLVKLFWLDVQQTGRKNIVMNSQYISSMK